MAVLDGDENVSAPIIGPGAGATEGPTLRPDGGVSVEGHRNVPAE
jgi:hypothetical protein